MYLVHENTETLVKAFLQDISAKPQSWRVISIEFQDCNTLYSPLFQNLCLCTLKECFGHTECRLYWNHAGSLLVFFQGRALPVEKCVETFLKETEFKEFGRFYDIFDLSVHWQMLLDAIDRIYRPAPPEKIQAKEALQPMPTKADTPSGFHFELSPERVRAAAPARQLRLKPLLLIVEDDSFTLQLVRLAMQDNFDIIVAETARQAILYYQRHLPDMVFQDIQLPDGSGIDILKQIAAVDPESYVVMLSSHAQREKILDCLNSGAKGFIGKPFTRQRLIDASLKFREERKTQHRRVSS